MADVSLDKKAGSHVHRSPAVSVIIPNYNTAEYIAETLDSVFAQRFGEFEVIVINDGAPDTERLHEVLRPYLERIVFIDKSENHGTAGTRNIAAGHARSRVLAFLDADDTWHPDHLSELTAFMAGGDYDVAYADGVAFFTGRPERDRDLSPLNPEQGLVTRRMLIEGRCHILPTGTLIKKEAFDAVGGFDPQVRRTEDFDLWMRMLFDGARFGYLRKLLFRFRLSAGSGSGDNVVRVERSRDMWLTLRRKLEFTDEENRIIDGHLGDLEAAIFRAKGHRAIALHDWATAREMFREASLAADRFGLPLAHRLRMRLVRLLLAVRPQLAHHLFRRLRPDELEFVVD